jgi:hypothetical protein
MINDFTVVIRNIRGIALKFEEPDREPHNRTIDISVIPETKNMKCPT